MTCGNNHVFSCYQQKALSQNAKFKIFLKASIFAQLVRFQDSTLEQFLISPQIASGHRVALHNIVYPRTNFLARYQVKPNKFVRKSNFAKKKFLAQEIN
jgi:hypothetical protein